MRRALTSLQGLSVGDAFGERFFGPPGHAQEMIAKRRPPPPKWGYTDDTVMALSVVDVLQEHQSIHRDALASAFAKRHEEEPDRGYGAGARQILTSIAAGVPWRVAAAEPFGEQGSIGNGGAMRAAPLGAYFADDVDRIIDESISSAVVTHLHPDAQAGTIAVALAAAYASQSRDNPELLGGASLLEFVERRTPPGEIRLGLRKAMATPASSSVEHAAAVLGSGYRISAADTVPFCLWMASRHLDNYEEALWNTVAGLGDRDTTCAIVGGIVVLRAGVESIPDRWLASREGLSLRYKLSTAPRSAK